MDVNKSSNGERNGERVGYAYDCVTATYIVCVSRIRNVMLTTFSKYFKKPKKFLVLKNQQKKLFKMLNSTIHLKIIEIQ